MKAFKCKNPRTCNWSESVDRKLNLAAPYHIFLSAIVDLPETHLENLTITFPELLDKSLGELEHSLHVNFMVDLSWLITQYAIADCSNPAITLLYGVCNDLSCGIPPYLKLTAVKIQTPYPFGHHHTKLSVFFYADKSVRFVVYTANLIESDWENRTQGLWIGPKCPYLGDHVPINYGESETFFKADILQYLNSYHLPELREWLIRIQKCDCSFVRVGFVASVPGDHESDYGYRKLGKLIKKHSETDPVSFRSNLIVQCSSIGSLGKTSDSWLLDEFAGNLCGTAGSSSNCQISIIYPSVKNVSLSLDGLSGGACLPYSSKTHERQPWLTDHLMQWKSDRRCRSRAVPHIKTYANVSSNGKKKLSWFLLTSANLSKAAWGKRNKSGLLRILSYEAGVVFFPRLLVGRESFHIDWAGNSEEAERDPPFPLPYDWPLAPYDSADRPFLFDEHF